MPLSSLPALPVIAAAVALALALGAAPRAQAADEAKPRPGPAEILARAPDADWRGLDPENTLVMTLPQGQVLIELAPRFAPRHVANIRALARGGFFDGLAVLRVQDNFVAQWGDPNGDDPAKARPLGKADAKIPAEFSVPLDGLPLTRLPDADGWAPLTGWVDGFPVGADPKTGRAWLAHCYGTVGAGRGNEVDSSTGAELYAVIGHAPRALDLNITTVGRVLKGIELLASLPRGGANMGFYDKPEQYLGIRSMRLLADLPPEQRPALQLLRTDSPSWQALLDARRHRGGWFVHSAGHLELCGTSVPSRPVPTTPPPKTP